MECGGLRTRLAGFVRKQFDTFSNPRLLAGNVAWQLGDKVVRLGLGALVTLLLARHLGPQQFGQLSFAIAFVALFGALANMGVQSIVVRDCVRFPDQRGEILASALLLRLVVGMVVIGLALATISVVRPHAWLPVLLLSLCWLPQAWDVVDYAFQAQLAARPAILARNGAFLLAAALKLVLIASSAPLWTFAAAQLFDALLLAVFFVGLSRSGSPGRLLRLGRVKWSRVRALAQEAWPLALGSVSVMLYMRIDQVMLGRLAGDEAVGIFAAAVTVSEAWYFVPGAVMTVLSPALTAVFERSQRDFAQQLSRCVRLLVWLGVAVALVLSVLAASVVPLLFGGHYDKAAAVLALHAWAGVFVAMGVASAPWAVNHGLLKIALCQALMGALVNVVLNFILIPRYGAIGAAWATLVSQAMAACGSNVLFASTRGLFVIQCRALVGLPPKAPVVHS